MDKINARIPDELRKQLEYIAEQRGIAWSQIIRLALWRFVEFERIKIDLLSAAQENQENEQQTGFWG